MPSKTPKCGPWCAQDQYLEITTAVPETASLYGLGERTTTTGIKVGTSYVSSHSSF